MIRTNRYSLFLVFILTLTWQGAQAVIPGTDAQGRPFPSLAPMLKQVNPAVVNISTYSRRESSYNPLLNDPFFRKFFDLPDNHNHTSSYPASASRAQGLVS